LRTSLVAVALTTASLAFCTAASAAFRHTVMPGETLFGIAQADGLSPSALAAANGLPLDAHVVTGTTILIPPAATVPVPVSSGTPGGPDGDGDADDGVAVGGGAGGPAPLGAHVVLPGETLSGIAARAGVSLRELAWMNGLSVSGRLLSGTALKLPAGAPNSQAAVPTGTSTLRVPAAPPNPTPGRVTSSQIASIAAANGVPASLASAIGWQESGFNNGMVSSANARGVMQIMPGTWQWVQHHLAFSPLDPNSATDNVKAGVLYLHELLRDTGGDPSQATAAYYQGLGSVRARGMLPETQRYVANVNALRARFGGP
jgi:LysM repeat protein